MRTEHGGRWLVARGWHRTLAAAATAAALAVQPADAGGLDATAGDWRGTLPSLPGGRLRVIDGTTMLGLAGGRTEGLDPRDFASSKLGPNAAGMVLRTIDETFGGRRSWSDDSDSGGDGSAPDDSAESSGAPVTPPDVPTGAFSASAAVSEFPPTSGFGNPYPLPVFVGTRGSPGSPTARSAGSIASGRCRAQGGAPRIVVSGFNSFVSRRTNVSGAVVQAMADPAFWPSSVRIADDPGAQAYSRRAATIGRSDDFSQVWSRRLVIDGQPYDACFVVLDVMWDLAAAILAIEVISFEPDVLLMMGRGGREPMFERAAVNRVMDAPSFKGDGTPLAELTPLAGPILPPGPGVEDLIEMTWDAARLRAVTAPLFADLGYRPQLAIPRAPASTFICNNVSLVLLHTTRGVTVRLVNEEVVLPGLRSKRPVVGFLHLPGTATTDGKSLYQWGRVVAQIIRTST